MHKYYIRRKKDPDLVIAKWIPHRLWLITDITKKKFIKYFSDPDSARDYMTSNLIPSFDWEIVYKDVKRYE